MAPLKTLLKKFWHFIWEEDSLLSWAVTIILAFLLIKFIVYPGLGLVLGTSFPVVAVVSDSMTHQGQDVDEWWGSSGQWYTDHDITKDQFRTFQMKNGFNRGDIIVLWRSNEHNTDIGDIIVFES